LQINISPSSGVLEDHRVGVHQVLKTAKHGSLEGFDALKVDIISVLEPAARGGSEAESKYHEM
jgi:hypothetical protein